jgi:hypothetical protein
MTEGERARLMAELTRPIRDKPKTTPVLAPQQVSERFAAAAAENPESVEVSIASNDPGRD